MNTQWSSIPTELHRMVNHENDIRLILHRQFSVLLVSIRIFRFDSFFFSINKISQRTALTFNTHSYAII